MRLLEFLSRLNEASTLNLGELVKDRGTPTRIQILLNKIQSGVPVETQIGRKESGLFKIDNSPLIISKLKELEKYTETTVKNAPFKSIDLTGIWVASGEKGKITTGNIIKTSEFGGGTGGSAGGSKTMDDTEAGTAFCAAVAQYNGGFMDEEDWSLEAFKSVQKYVKANATPAYLAEINDKTVIHSCVASGNLMFNALDTSKKYVFCQRHFGCTDAIYNAFAKCKSREKITLHPDKWNPGDVWAIREGAESDVISAVQNIARQGYLEELNGLIYKWLMNDTVVSFSLKKLGKTSLGNVHNYNLGKNSKTNVKFTKLSVKAESKDIFNSKYCVVDFDIDGKPGGTVALRGKGSLTTFAFNLKFNGESALGGSISGKNLFADLGIQMPDISKIDLNNQTFANEFWTLYSKFDSQFRNKDEFIKIAKEQGINWVTEKYLGMICLQRFAQSDGQDIFRKCFYTASSQTDYSSAFIKIS